jgi:hypothetical protein
MMIIITKTASFSLVGGETGLAENFIFWRLDSGQKIRNNDFSSRGFHREISSDRNCTQSLSFVLPARLHAREIPEMSLPDLLKTDQLQN